MHQQYIDFVGEYHLNLLVQNSAVPIILPRVPPTHALLDAYEPIDGLLLAEGEDIGPSFTPSPTTLDPSIQDAIRDAHPGDVETDPEKDNIEFELVHRCLERRIPILAICRGSQIINVASGGTIIPDIDIVLNSNVSHIDYQNYDAHRHPIHLTPHTPIHTWFGEETISVNSYHHQAVDKLAPRFQPMAYAPDGVLEAFYDPSCYDPKNGEYLVGLQFHPERMQDVQAPLNGLPTVYDYPGCVRPYQDFVKAATVFCHHRRKLESLSHLHDDFKENNSRRMGNRPALQHDSLHNTKNRDRHNRSFASLVNIENAKVSTPSIKQRYSKEEWDCIMRSGGTVHGSTLLLRMLAESDAPEHVETDHMRRRVKSKGLGNCVLSEWRKLVSGIQQAQLALENLRGTERMDEAVSLVDRLSQVSVVPHAEPMS